MSELRRFPLIQCVDDEVFPKVEPAVLLVQVRPSVAELEGGWDG